MNFAWNMTEKDWKMLVEEHTTHQFRENQDADIYGQVKIGAMCADIQHTLDNSDWYPYVNVYAQGIDDYYGETLSGTPYALLDPAPMVPINAKSFEEFKIQFEQLFEECINNYPQMQDLAKRPLASWD